MDTQQSIIEINECKRIETFRQLQKILHAKDPAGTIIFVETARDADYLAGILSENKLPATSIHGDRWSWQRKEAINDFKNGKYNILVATPVAVRRLGTNYKHLTFDRS